MSKTNIKTQWKTAACKWLLSWALVLGAVTGAWAQNIKVTGTVTDADGMPIPFASIVLPGTMVVTATELDGTFSLEAPLHATIEISYMGYKTLAVEVTGTAPMAIVLEEDSQMLEELVVVGYGTQKKSDITGSVASVSKDRLSKLPVSNVLQAVQGTTAGVTITQNSSMPGESPSTIVRGQNSINAGNSPYIVVDGIPLSNTDGSLLDINPNDIESIEILKDASATAIYGTNGANGVILVTTKRGVSGKPIVRYSGYIGIEEMANVPDFCTPNELVARYKEGARINGTTMYAENVKYENEVYNYNNGITTDWIDLVSQPGIINDNNVSIAGATDRADYYVSADYMDQQGVVKGYNYKRYSFRSNVNAQVTDWFKIGTSSYIVGHNKDGGRANLLNATAMSPWAKVYEDDGSLCIYPMFSETLWSNPLLNTTTSPERRSFNISVNGYALVDFGNMWKPLKGLTYKFNAGYTYLPRREDYYTGVSVNDQNGTATRYNYESQAYTIENIVAYNRDFGKHHVDLTALYAASRKKYTQTMAKAIGFVNDELDWDNLAAGSTASVSSYSDLYATISQMGRINYSYDSRYLFTFTVRRDGSSVFGANNKYGVFPSMALGWNIARERFVYENAEWLNNLKLRASYGKQGNEAIGVYQSITTMSSTQIAMEGGTNIAMIANKLGNSDLSWETTHTLNIGVDFGLFADRVTGTVDYYRSRTTDLLLQRQLPTVSGYSSVYTNLGETANRGIEVTLQSRNIVTRNFTWGTSLVFAQNKNEIVDLYGDKTDDIGNRWFIGQPIGVIYDYTKEGIWQESEIASGAHQNVDPIAKAGDVKLADLNGDGQISADDKSVLGQTAPKWTGGLTNTFTYKDFALSVFIQTVQGAMRNNRNVGMASDELQRRQSMADVGYWTPENQSNEWRSLNTNSNPHGYGFPYKANYTRLKDITLSYTFRPEVINKIGIAGLSLYVSGRNLYTFTDWIGWDPEERDDPRGSGSWDVNYPTVRSFIFGVNITL